MGESTIKDILAEIHLQSEAGNRRALTAALRLLMDRRLEYYHQCEQEQLLDEYADALYKILLLEMDEEEEDSIELAELTYLSLGSVLNQSMSVKPEHYKRRLLLLHYFSDYFTDSVIEIFLKKYRKDHILQARNLALECLEKMQLADMFYLEENEPDFIERDDQLTDACNAIETSPDLSEEERLNASLFHKVMYAYLKVKYNR